MFFGIRPLLATLSDINGDLINTYLQVRERPEELLNRLRNMSVDKVTYLATRAAHPTDPIDQAVRFLYLNRTAFGGMYRLDQAGKFNVPFGGGERTPAVLWTRGLLLHASAALQTVTLKVGDFEESMAQAGLGDLVYCDPTYTVAHNNNGFVRYNEKSFSWSDQQRLAQTCQSAANRGAFVLVSNACHPEIARLYTGAEIHILPRKSLLARDPAKRGVTSEYLILLRPKTIGLTPQMSAPVVASLVGRSQWT